jgi:hypothetical protein
MVWNNSAIKYQRGKIIQQLMSSTVYKEWKTAVKKLTNLTLSIGGATGSMYTAPYCSQKTVIKLMDSFVVPIRSTLQLIAFHDFPGIIWSWCQDTWATWARNDLISGVSTIPSVSTKTQLITMETNGRQLTKAVKCVLASSEFRSL